jgi:hypothetical protein
MLMTFFDSRKGISCMLGSFFSQSVHLWATIGGRDVTTFSSNCNFFTRCLAKKLLDVLHNKLSSYILGRRRIADLSLFGRFCTLFYKKKI